MMRVLLVDSDFFGFIHHNYDKITIHGNLRIPNKALSGDYLRDNDG